MSVVPVLRSSGPGERSHGKEELHKEKVWRLQDLSVISFSSSFPSVESCCGQGQPALFC